MEEIEELLLGGFENLHLGGEQLDFIFVVKFGLRKQRLGGLYFFLEGFDECDVCGDDGG